MDQQKAENSMIISMSQKAITPSHNQQLKHVSSNSTLKKGKGSKNIFKVALFMMRGRSRKSEVLPMDDNSKSLWRKLLGSMRPLHLQSNQCPPHNNNNNVPKKMITSTATPSENSEDGFEYASSEFAYSPSPSSSRYASAVGLNEMVQEKEEEEEEEEELKKENDDDEGDEMIDAKAEEFIAQFYHEMRLQRLDITDRRYREISMRSLGL